ncbi:hypothetical protein [Amycolatopsis saalfeldensis]|uniref:Uncharacterized protein n=1 Tax=Amycolatopsis saalfeldensis TaxID=394193 RepID=A0A1H8VVW9_9PSEU|nr:hypothetical protein [Amycolatopsis saalfeldensis]SEP19387.1 hypothetical protein SAMN04489732_104330 [Amycolatopsis saalfeldensis]
MWSVVVPVILATAAVFAVTRFRAAGRKLDELLAEIDEREPPADEGRAPRPDR